MAVPCWSMALAKFQNWLDWISYLFEVVRMFPVLSGLFYWAPPCSCSQQCNILKFIMCWFIVLLSHHWLVQMKYPYVLSCAPCLSNMLFATFSGECRIFLGPWELDLFLVSVGVLESITSLMLNLTRGMLILFDGACICSMVGQPSWP